MTIDTPASTTASSVRGTSTPATRVLGVLSIAMTLWLGVFGLLLSPADRDQGDAVRIMYVHVPSVWLAYLAFIVTAFASAVHLFGRRHSLQADRVAGASAEIGVVFMAVTLVTGMLWGRITWGVYWQWDARLTTTKKQLCSELTLMSRLMGSCCSRCSWEWLHSRCSSCGCCFTGLEC